MNRMIFPKNIKVHIGALVLVFAGAAQAIIPVTDAAHITTSISNQVESIAKWGQQFNQMQQQIQQYRQQYAAITSSRGMGGLLDNSALQNTLPSDWKEVLSNVKTTIAFATERGKYPTLDSRPKANAMYDVIASQNTVMDDLYSKSTKRLALIKSLTSQIDSANDPAAKADLSNRLMSEQNAIQANQNLVTILQTKQKQEMEAAGQLAAEEFSCKEFKRSGC
jgi:type IV secretion system protein VirB5